MSNNNDREMDSLFFYILASDVWSREGIESDADSFLFPANRGAAAHLWTYLYLPLC